MHDAFDEIPPRDMFKIPLPTTCFESPRGSSNRACKVTIVHEPGTMEVSKRKYRFCMCCQRIAFKKKKTATDLEPN